ncbi:MAG: hypothetical protein M1319_02130 [Chloroflexi bacterium]|nr:hypothetical protein [Chloroflexota bacterium]
MAPLYNEDGEMLFVAGDEAPAGHYVRVDVAQSREVLLKARDFLPASHDGHVAVYRRVDKNWLAILGASEQREPGAAAGL